MTINDVDIRVAVDKVKDVISVIIKWTMWCKESFNKIKTASSKTGIF